MGVKKAMDAEVGAIGGGTVDGPNRTAVSVLLANLQLAKTAHVLGSPAAFAGGYYDPHRGEFGELLGERDENRRVNTVVIGE